MINALHIDFTAIDVIGQGSLENMLDLNIPNGAALHSKQIVLLVHLAPIHHHTDFLFEDAVQPNPHASAVALPEGVRNIHFYILFYDLVEGGLGYFFML